MPTTLRFVIFLICTALVASVAFFVPVLVQQDLASVVAVTAASALTLLGAALYFLRSLRLFKRGLKVAYYLLTMGIVLYSVIPLQTIYFLLTGSEDVFLRNTLFLAPFGLASFFAYLGMRKFARLLEVKHVMSSFLVVLAVALVLAGLVTFLPLPQALLDLGVDALTLHIIASVLTWSVVFGMSAAVVALYVRGTISATYKRAMVWTSVALLMIAFSALHELVVKTYFFDSDYVVSSVSLWPFIVTGIIFLRAGLAFKATQVYNLQLAEDASYVDVVTATAGLVSKPVAVDAELDKLRAITSHLSDPKKLSADEKTTLKQVYLYLEEYLVTREPLSKFSREMLRESLPKEFAASLGRQLHSDVFRAQSQKTT